MCGSRGVVLASLRSCNVIMQNLKFRPSNKNRSVLHDMRSRKAIWRLLSITVCAVVLTSLQQSYVEDGERSL